MLRRKLAVVAAVASALALTFAMAGVASANNGPHGGYGYNSTTGWTSFATTDGCAGCHRAHTGETETLLAAPSVTALCKSCHQGGTGALTDVFAGVLDHSTQPLNGGGFLTAVNIASGAVAPVTSRHNVNALDAVAGTSGTLVSGTGSGMAYGGGDPNSAVVGVQGQLECTSCHDPHGSQNYRILKGYGSSHGQAVPVSWTNDGTTQGAETATFGLNNVGAPAAEIAPGAHKYANGNNVVYDRGISDFCATCHTNYVRSYAGTRTPAGQEQQYNWSGTGAQDTWRHAVSMKAAWNYTTNSWDTSVGTYAGGSSKRTPGTYDLRRVQADGATPDTAGNVTGGALTCVTCHFAHGTSAAAIGQASKEAMTGDSSILYLDNRGVCEDCHKK